MTQSADAMRSRAALACAAFGLSAPVVYILQRVIEVARSPNLDPVLILSTTHTSFYWRADVAVFAGGVIAIATFAQGGERLKRILAITVLPLIAVVAISAWAFP